MKLLKKIGRFSVRLFEICLPIYFFGLAFYYWRCGVEFSEVARYLFTGVIILTMYWYAHSMSKIRDKFCKDTHRILSEQWGLIRMQQTVIDSTKRTITTMEGRAKLFGEDKDE